MAIGGAMAPDLSGPRQAPAYGGPARQLVVLLHGYGADGADLIGLAPQLGQVLPGAAFVSPHGPEACEMAPVGRQWFSLADYDPGLMRRDPRHRDAVRVRMLEGTQGAAPVLDRFLDQELERAGLDESRLAILGFSQGTMMALYVGLRRARAPACIVGFSGSLVGADRLAEEARSKPPLLLVHGDADETVPVDALFSALQGLAAAELGAEWHISPGTGHGIAPDGLRLAAGFLRHYLER